MAESKLGQYTTDVNRDAVHVAVIPATLRSPMKIGTPVYLELTMDGYMAFEAEGSTHNAVGIIDPFLRDDHIRGGSRIWVLMYPNTVENLRHEWDHALVKRPGIYDDGYDDQNECRGC